MLTCQFLYKSIEDLQQQLSPLDGAKPCVIQLFTNALLPDEAVSLAATVQGLYPLAQVLGTSVSGVIFQGEQYDNETLVVAEQYDTTTVSAHMISLERKTYGIVAREMQQLLGTKQTSLVRLFIGAYYDYAHQLMEEMNRMCPGVKIVGGMAGELQPDPKVTPFVFNAHQAQANALVCCVLENQDLMVYGRVNTAHECLGEVHTITDTRDRLILAIEGENAQSWLQRNFGVLSTKHFGSWEEIAQNDPLVRLQLALESHKRAIRFIHYDEENNEITQYFSRLPAGSKFRISYTSPSKCAEESRETCVEVAHTPIEQLFCYSCLFRKLYMKNCAKWELKPFHQNHVNGVFLLGEFGYSQEEGNALLNGSCVLSGVAEQEHYLSVDMTCLDNTDDIRSEDEKLMDFIIRKQREPSSSEHQKMLEDMIAHETNHLSSPYQRMDVGVVIGDMNKYDRDKTYLHFNKLCLVRVENADALIGQRGHVGYFSHLKYILEHLKDVGRAPEVVRKLHFYSVKDDTFLIASSPVVNKKQFSTYITALQERCDKIQQCQTEMPFLLRFVLVRNHPFLLERAYAMMQDCRHSQMHIVVDDHFEDGELAPTQQSNSDELTTIQLIQYALANDKVIPYYQGLYNNQTGCVDKYEALMRLEDQQGRIYSPHHFMEVSKKYRMYLDLNLKMFQAVLRDFSQLDCSVSINLSVHDILSSRFYTELRQALATFFKPSNLTFELLEDECIANMEGIKEFIAEVRSYGAKVAVDDFGSGYSNLLEIMKIRPDYIKIDGQIISNLMECEENESILEAVALLGKRLSIDLVAEFVENAAIQERIMAHSVFYSQGYHFSKPKPFQEVLIEATTDWGMVRRAPAASTILPTTLHQENDTQEERDFFHAIQSLTSDLLFRLDLRTNTMRHFGMAQAELGVPALIKNFPQNAIDNKMVVEEDVPAMLHSLNQMRKGIEEPGYFRLYNQSRKAMWYRMDYKIVADERGIPVEVIGKLSNIQQQKELEERINIDPLTGCLRKDAFETLVSEYIAKNPECKGMLLIVDLDNFKSVNDNLGHQFGDRVLRGAGDKLRSLFRGNDLVGRIGGDEFMVMMTGCDDLEVAKKKAKEILAALSATYAGAVHSYHVSASIGIASYPQDGIHFQALYDHADIALFDAKNRGKNGYVIYHSTLSKGTMENTLPYEVAARTLAQHYDTKVVQESFNLLFETKEFDISLQTVLELIGKRFGVSRCYIFEKHPTVKDAYRNTYEWCNKGVTTEKENLDAIPLWLFQEFFDQANGDGVLYCNDLSMLKQPEGRAMMEAQNIKSFLHTYTISDDAISYVIGVDACDTARIWTPIEVSTILQSSKIIAQFLSYKKAVEGVETIAHERLNVLDSMDYFTYIVDRHSHELLFFNKHTQAHLPSAALGQRCYEVFRGNTAPCENCPMKKLEETGQTTLRSITPNTALGGHMLTITSFQSSFCGRESASITAISLDDMAEIQVVDSH